MELPRGERGRPTGAKNRPETERSKRFSVEFVKNIEEVGPNVAELARRMGIDKKTARDWYRAKLANKGVKLRLRADYRVLGLRRVLVVARVNEDYRKLVQELFLAMDNHWYITGYIGTMPDDLVLVHVTVPDEWEEEFLGFMTDLRDKLRFFTAIEALETDWFRNAPMMARYYDFDRGRWSFGLGPAHDSQAAPKTHRRSIGCKFDATDLAIIGKLQRDATISLAEVARRLNIPYSKVLRHNDHVMENGLTAGFLVHWIRTDYVEEQGRATTRNHAYLFETVIVTGLDESEAVKLQRELQRLPFTWSSGGGVSCVYADYAIPLEWINETMGYLRRVLADHNEGLRYFTTNQNDSVFFTLPFKMYDSKARRWLFDREEVLDRFAAELERLSGRGRAPLEGQR